MIYLCICVYMIKTDRKRERERSLIAKLLTRDIFLYILKYLINILKKRNFLACYIAVVVGRLILSFIVFFFYIYFDYNDELRFSLSIYLSKSYILDCVIHFLFIKIKNIKNKNLRAN